MNENLDLEIKARQKRKKIGGVVTERDIKACRFVCEQGVATVDQLWKACWWTPESNSSRHAYDRVLFLTRSGFFEGIRSPHSLKTYFKATRMAQEAASEFGEGLGSVPLSTPPISEIRHSDGLTELRLAVTKSQPYALWKTDRMLLVDPSFPRERFFNHVPDAIWTTPKGNRVAVEYERTRKTLARTRLKVETFSREMSREDRAFDLCLWIGVPGTMPTLAQVLAAHPAQKLRTMDQFLSELKGT